MLWGGRLAAGEQVVVPDAGHVHLYVAVGSASLDGTADLDVGDAVRFTHADPHPVVAGDEGAEVLIRATT